MQNSLKDTRDFPQIDIGRIFKSCFYGFAFGLKSVKSIEEETVSGALKKSVGPISDDSIKYGLEHLERRSVQTFWNHLPNPENIVTESKRVLKKGGKELP